ncbi:MAG: AAA family ATPase [Dehalococcoidia bacterium]|nr:AAA family ATPase [Dehalococcoidia bacterium]
MQTVITDDLDALLAALPPRVAAPLRQGPHLGDLLEVVLDLGRPPEARFPGREEVLSELEVSREELGYVIERVGAFGEDNRAGIERTLHRFSALRNRKGDVVGLTCRVGRAVFGTIKIIEDLVQSGQSLLLLGAPGVGKTTMLREVARVLADDLHKRVVVVDTSNEIAGDGDIPHPAIGHARRLQVPKPSLQHAVMIEAVENHMPEVIVIDEIGTELEATAARTIAERGVQLVGTAHGNTLENLMLNPTLADLIGGIQTVTLGDEEARRRGTQKSVLERKAPPTFSMVVEIQAWDRVAVHPKVDQVVDAILRGLKVTPETRWRDAEGQLRMEPGTSLAERSRRGRRGVLGAQRLGGRQETPPVAAAPRGEGQASAPSAMTRVLLYGLGRGRLEQAAAELQLPVQAVDSLAEADVVLTLKSAYRRQPAVLKEAQAAGVPIYVLRSNTPLQLAEALDSLREARGSATYDGALREAEDAIATVEGGQPLVELNPQNSFVRRLQHQLAERHQLTSHSRGREPFRRVKIFRSGALGREP